MTICIPQPVANIAIQEDVEVVAISQLNGANMTLFTKVGTLSNNREAKISGN